MLYDKIMTVKSTIIKGDAAAGNMINIAASDLELFEFAIFAITLISTPVYFIGVLAVLYLTIGVAGFVGWAMMLVFTVGIIFASKVTKSMRMKIGKFSDKRTRLLTNVIEGIRICKLYGWDEGFIRLISDIKAKEAHRQAFKFMPSSL